MITSDDYLHQIRDDLVINLDSHPNFSMVQGHLIYKDRLFLLAHLSLIPNILHTYHDSVLRGHFEYLRTYKRESGELYWQVQRI